MKPKRTVIVLILNANAVMILNILQQTNLNEKLRPRIDGAISGI
jgi:hypothetical protein